MSTESQRSFTGGELAPSLYARCDTTKYASGLRTCRNFLVMKHGGVSNRPGTAFVGEIKDSSKTVRLIPFVFNSTQTYVLEFGDLYMRVIRDGAHVTETATNITGITNANPAVVTSVGHGYTTGDELYISGIVGMTELNGRNLKITVLTADTYSLQYLDGTNVNSTAYTAYSSGGTAERVYKITTPYVEADLPALQFVQSADVITLTHPSYAVRKLSRTAHTSWALSTFAIEPSISQVIGLTQSGAAGTVTYWTVSAIKEETFEEGPNSGTVGSSAVPTAGAPITLNWTPTTNAQSYNVYKSLNGVFGFIGVAGSTSFVDNGITPDTSDTPPILGFALDSTDYYPGAVAYYQQRLLLANSNTFPEKIWASKSGQFSNFTTSSPTQDDDSIVFNLAGKQVNSIKHMVDLGQLVIFTAGGEWAIQGDSSGTLKPGEVNPKQYSSYGSGTIPPIAIGGTALFLQSRGSIVRSLGFDFQTDGYRGNDLTTFSTHLFEGYTISDWAFQQNPHSIVWAVRSDGTMLGLTYIPEQQILAWHRHDFDGTIENVCVIPEGINDTLYIVVKRTINGSTKRYIERFESRFVSDIVDAIFMDSSLSYDGRNTTATSMTLSGGTTWGYDELITITASAAYFTSASVGNQIHLTGSDGTIIRFTLDNYTSTTVMTGRPSSTVPVSMRSTAITNWTYAVDTLGGLWHLEGKEVSVLGDGFVVASPNNDAYTTVTVTDGSITLDKPYGVIHVGLPYISDLQTLDIDTVQGETLSDKDKIINKVTMFVEASRGGWAGSAPPSDDTVDPLEGLNEFKIPYSGDQNIPTELRTENISINIQTNWNSNGRVFIRQVEPLPMAVLSICPAGLIPKRP